MTPQPRNPWGLKWGAASFWAAAALLLTLVLGLTAFNLWRLRTVALDNGLVTAAQFANAFEEHLSQTLSLVDVNLVNLAELDKPDSAMAALMRHARYIRSISFTDAQGVVVHSSEARNLGLRVEDSALLPQGPEPLSILRIGPLTGGRDLFNAQAIKSGQAAPAQTFILVQRQLSGADGHMKKVLAVINPDYFLNYYDRQMGPDDSTIELLRPDGGLLLSTAPSFEPNSQHNLRVTQQLQVSESGQLPDDSYAGTPWLTAYRASRSFPATVVVHLDRDKLLSVWRSEAWMSLILVGTLMAIALIGSGVYVARSRQWASERENWIKDLNNQKYALDQHAIVSVSDLQGHITYANDRFCHISGYTQQELLGQSHRLINAGVHPEEFFETLWSTIAQSRVWHNEMCCRKKNGEVFWVNATIVPFLDVDGRVQQYISISTDITDRKQAERSLQIAKETAEQATGAKSQFLANMSHEIRTPMNAILGLLQLLQRTEMDGVQKAYVTQTENSARALLGLLNDILDFSKVEAGQMQLDLQAFGLQDWVRELSVILTHNLGPKPVQLKVEVDPNLPDTLLGDDMRLRQILINLGSNAIKFTAQGQVIIRVAQVQRQQNDVTLRFSVTDTGIGIAPEHLSRIFEGFSQAEASTTRRFGGTGLGLSICKQLVKMMGGELCVNSTLGQGSEFSFTIPLTAVPSAPVNTKVPPTGAVKTQRLQGMRLLVVEDNLINQMVAQKLLSQEGAEVTLADNGELGMRAAITAEPGFDAVLMDVQMPVMDGYEAAKAIGLHMGHKQPPIIAMTANAMASDRQACLDAGMKDHIGKPFMLDQLVALLHRHTENKAQANAAPVND